MPSVPTDRLGRWGCMARTAGRRLVAGGSVSPPLFPSSHEDNQRHREAPFLSLWAGAQDLELPAWRPRRATGRAPDWPLAGRHPEPRAAQPAGARASLLLKPSCHSGSDMGEGWGAVPAHGPLGSEQITNALLLCPSQRGDKNSEKSQVPSATQQAHSRALRERRRL